MSIIKRVYNPRSLTRCFGLSSNQCPCLELIKLFLFNKYQHNLWANIWSWAQKGPLSLMRMVVLGFPPTIRSIPGHKQRRADLGLFSQDDTKHIFEKCIYFFLQFCKIQNCENMSKKILGGQVCHCLLLDPSLLIDHLR